MGGAGGASGTPDPDAPGPLELQLAYGDPDRDAGASLGLSITLPDGSQREMQMPNATNDYRHALSPEIPAGSTVIVTPKFLKGYDDDPAEDEREEVRVEVSATGTPAVAMYVVFKQGDTTGSIWDLFGPFNLGSYIAKVLDSEKLAIVPLLAIINKTAATDDDFVAVSNGTDPDLSTELSLQLGAGITGTYTAELSMQGNDGGIKFDQTTISLTPGTPVIIKMWGTLASSAKASSAIQITLTSGTKQAVAEKPVTVINGIKLSFEGRFCSTIPDNAIYIEICM
jgi:hypothetical protein